MPEPDGGWASLWALDPQVQFLNHGSFGACPRHVLDYQAQLRERLERQPVEFLGRQLPQLLDETRQSVARFLACAADNLVFVRNATAGVNAVLQSLPLNSGDELVVTDHAYAASRNALDFAAQRAGARVRVAPVPFPLESADQIVQAITNCVTPRTRLVMIDHITSPTALIFPLERLLRELGGVEVLVDGAHAPGMVEVNLQQLEPTYYAGNCHKWLCAPKGSGFLYVQRERQAQIRPTSISHGATVHGGRSRFQAEFDWTGTDDPTAILSVPEAIRYLGSLLPGGWPALMARNRALALEARRRLSAALSIPLPCPDEMIGSMAALPIPGGSARPQKSGFAIDPLQQGLLERFKIEVPIDAWTIPSMRLLRLSAQL
jgi:isopenicillin-N epimerase